jgi:hypothetical protein
LALLEQPVVHVWFVLLQTPFAPLQSASWLHSTHVFWSTSTDTSHTAPEGVHNAGSAPVHGTQLPAGTPCELGPVSRHAGWFGEKHVALFPTSPRLPSQATQVPAALQIGVAPPQSALVLHCTHVWLVSLQAPMHSLEPPGSVVH